MKYLSKAYRLVDNYIIARWQKRPSTAAFWYLPEPPNIQSVEDLERYQNSKLSPFYLIDYRQKLQYPLENNKGIIVLPYDPPIGKQINPEAAFQYALGLHDEYLHTSENRFLKKFLYYADYFLAEQNEEGLWGYKFDWYGSKAPWFSALAQGRGASVMLRAWLITQDDNYLTAAKLALSKFKQPTSENGFLHYFSKADCFYFEEYPNTPTGVINGFMASLMCIWEIQYWTQVPWLTELWKSGFASLQAMLPYYSTGWWSLYDLDQNTPVANVNSPRYHLLEINYLKILNVLSASTTIADECQRRIKQHENIILRTRALTQKITRKILYK